MYVFRILRSGCSYATATAVYCAAPSIKWGTSIHYRKLDSFLIFASSADRLYLSYPLVPPTNTYSSPAEAALAHPDNDHLVSWMRNKPVLDVGHTRTISGDSATLATLGRNGDIKIQDHRIAKEQCSFEIDNETKVIMFHDRSIRCTCQVFGENAMPFEFGRPRKVVVQRNLNTIIGMGGSQRDSIQFMLVWHGSSSETMEKVKNRNNAALEDNPRFARTVDDADTVPPTGMMTRIHTPRTDEPRIRFRKMDRIGGGQYGEVFKAVNVDTGQLIAVKIVKLSTGRAGQYEWNTLKRETEMHSKISHVSQPPQAQYQAAKVNSTARTIL